MAAVERIELWLCRDDPCCAAQRTGAVEGALRAPQNLDAIDIDKFQIGAAGGKVTQPRYRRFVDINPNNGGRVLGVGRNAADVHGGAARASVLQGHVGNGLQVVAHADQLLKVDELLGDHRCAHCDILQALVTAFLRRDNDLFQDRGVLLFGLLRPPGRSARHTCQRNRGS